MFSLEKAHFAFKKKFRNFDAPCNDEASVLFLIRLDTLTTGTDDSLLDGIANAQKHFHVTHQVSDVSYVKSYKEGSIQSAKVPKKGGSIPRGTAEPSGSFLSFTSSHLLQNCHRIFSESSRETEEGTATELSLLKKKIKT